jgi:DNA-directed RNA polymerase specialized sigma24 family protein
VAYATTGSLAEAEDCVPEAWLRLLRVPDPGSIRDLAAWLTTTVSRLALDALGSELIPQPSQATRTRSPTTTQLAPQIRGGQEGLVPAAAGRPGESGRPS